MKKFFFLLFASFLSFSVVAQTITKKGDAPVMIAGVTASIVWTPTATATNGVPSYKTPSVYTTQGMFQARHFRFDVEDTWSHSNYGVGGRKIYQQNCILLANGNTYCDQVFRDTFLETKLKTGTSNMSAVYLFAPIKFGNGIFVFGGGLNFNAIRTPDAHLDDTDPANLVIMVNKNIYFETGAKVFAQFRNKYSTKPKTWNLFGEMAVTTAGQMNALYLKPEMKMRVTYNINPWLFVGSDFSFKSEGSDYARYAFNAIVGTNLSRNLNLSFSSGLNSIAQQATTSKGQISHNIALNLRYGF